MESICTDLFIGNNWRLSEQVNGSLGYYYYNANTNTYTLTATLAPPSSNNVVVSLLK